MKAFFMALSLLASVNSYATGGFFCNAEIRNNDIQVDVQISGTTGRVIGNPLVANLIFSIDNMSDLRFEIQRENVVGYWNLNNELKLNALDEQAMESVVLLNYDIESQKGSLEVNFQGIVGKTDIIECQFE
jgi:hypothetical protein